MRMSTWMEDHGYEAVNSEKTIIMKKHENRDCIMHGLFVDDLMPSFHGMEVDGMEGAISTKQNACLY